MPLQIARVHLFKWMMNISIAFPGGSVVKKKNLPTNVGDTIQSLGWEGPLEKEMATHYSILAWKSCGQRSLVSYSPWGHKRVRHD